MNLHMPHPRRNARERRARQQATLRAAVRRARLADRTPQTWDVDAALQRQQEGGRSS
jgi:hypothetical protein